MLQTLLLVLFISERHWESKRYNYRTKISAKTIVDFLVNNSLNPWTKQREMPAPPEESFREWYKKNGKEFKEKDNE